MTTPSKSVDTTAAVGILTPSPVSINTPATSINSTTSKQQRKDIGIFWHPACSLHYIPGHPESPARVDSILQALRNIYPSDVFLEAPRVTTDQVLLFHSKRHLNFFNTKNSEAQTSSRRQGKIDSDTIMMDATAEAAFRAAGSVCSAVDKIYNREFRSIFCCVRPPGHHAETSKMCGFCFLANAGIAAKYAQSQYGVKKVAILDFDVHHGNGSEDGALLDDSLFYGSTHEKDNFPRTGTDPSPFVGAKAKNPLHRRIVNRYLIPVKRGIEESVRQEFYVKWAEIIEEMVLFSPELVIISAGFDAHDDDPLASCDLIEEDFSWATRVVFDACVRINASTPPPVLSVLEGGYDIPALTRSAVAHVKAMAEGYPTTTPRGPVAVTPTAVSGVGAVVTPGSGVRATESTDEEEYYDIPQAIVSESTLPGSSNGDSVSRPITKVDSEEYYDIPKAASLDLNSNDVGSPDANGKVGEEEYYVIPQTPTESTSNDDAIDKTKDSSVDTLADKLRANLKV